MKINSYRITEDAYLAEIAIADAIEEWQRNAGRSLYLRPSFGIGSDRPTDGSIEIGYKIVGF